MLNGSNDSSIPIGACFHPVKNIIVVQWIQLGHLPIETGEHILKKHLRTPHMYR